MNLNYTDVMSTWTEFRVLIECSNTEQELREILGNPLPDVTDDNLDDDPFWVKAEEECHLPIGSEGSADYSIFPIGDSSCVILIVGNLRDYKQEKGWGWYNSFEKKLHAVRRHAVIIRNNLR